MANATKTVKGYRPVRHGQSAILTASSLFLTMMTAGRAQPELVYFDTQIAAHTIVVRTAQRKLYLVLEDGQALRYRVGVGRPARQWSGHTYVETKFIQPNWAPPALIRRVNPGLPAMVPGGSPLNPLGAAALTLAGGDYAIHGTRAEPELIES